jgi:hypothetical protein
MSVLSHQPTIKHLLAFEPATPSSSTDMQVADGLKSNKRTKSTGSGQDTSRSMSLSLAQPMQTPQIKTEPLPKSSPSHASPHRSTPGSATKPPVVKALPTVRDHTTDQLGAEGDEYIPREIDQDGETKVSKDGYPLEGRKYRCRTFQVPNRGEKLFMLATECARVLGYRDSYLLFNKNRSLFKIIANQQEKDNLIQQEILPYSYRSRQIAIVTARSMFRQFGARLIENGRRVRDDYWEAKARKQGFTEEDAAGEKRPGAAKAREAAAAEASSNALTSLPQGEIIYNSNGLEGHPPGLLPATLAPLPMIHLPSEDLRPGSYGNVIRPRQEITGPAYQDRTQTSSATEILAQASHAAEFNKQLGATRQHRSQYLENYWKRPHEQPSPQGTQPEGDLTTVAPQHLQSPQAVAGGGQPRLPQQESMSHHSSQMMPQSYSGFPNQQNPMASPVSAMPRPMPAGQMHQSSPSMSMGPGQQHRQTPSYGGYPSNQMWQPPLPQPSPLSQSHAMSQYGQQQQAQQQQQQHQQQHQQQQPNQMLPPQMSGQGNMGYGQMNAMANPAYGNMNRSMYQPSPSPQQFGMQSTAAQQSGMQSWSQAPGSMPQYGQGFQ